MRYLTLLLAAFLIAACASDISVEESQASNFYPSPAETTTDTTPPVAPKASPTPYGMVIEEPSPAVGSKSPASATDQAPALAAQRMLTGIWINTADNLERVEFTPTHYKTFYEGEMLVEEDMRFYGACPAACTGGTPSGRPCFTISGPAQTDCYGIVRLTEDLLELQLLGISSETVIYRRAD